MKMKKPIFAILLLALLAATTAFAAEPLRVLSSEGAILEVRSGLYGELFPEGAAADAEASVLVLDVRSNGGFERLLIPGTESHSVETPAAIHFANASKSAYLLWEGFENIHPMLYLAEFDGANWTNAVEITGNVFADKGQPQLVLTRDTVAPKGDESSSFAQSSVDGRNVIVLTWWEEAGVGSFKRIAPIVFNEGRYIDRLPIRELDDLLGAQGEPTAEIDPDLEHLLRIQPGMHGNTAVVGYLSRITGKITAFEIETLPRALSDLSERIGEFVETEGASAGSLEELAVMTASRVAELGTEFGFHPSSVQFLAQEIYELILDETELTSGSVAGLRPKLGPQIIHIGNKVESGGLAGPDDVLEILEIAPSKAQGGPKHHIAVSLLGEYDAPPVGGEAALYLSSTGRDAALVWSKRHAVFYRETTETGWSEVRRIEVNEDIDHETAYRLIEENTLNK